MDVARCTTKRVLEAKPAGGHTSGEINSPDTRVDVKPKLFRTGVRLPPPPPMVSVICAMIVSGKANSKGRDKNMKKLVLLMAGMLIGVMAFAQEVINLNGSWEFRFEDNKFLEDVADVQFKKTGMMSVPGCYDMMPNQFVKRGTGLYRRTFELEKDVLDARLVVDGMGLRGKFMLDGKDLGLVALPYSRFELATGPLKAGTHTLFAAIDNNFDPEKMKLVYPYYDYYAFGGFYHGVSLKLQTHPVQLDRVFVRTRDYKTGKVELELAFLGNAPKDFTAKVRFDTEKEAREVSFKNSRATLNIPDCKLWSPKAPNLHFVNVEAFGSKLRERFGVREFKAGNKRFYLNGEMIYLKGVNRHESHPQFGASTPETQMVEDIQLLKSLGGNFIRGAHYPQSQRFLDLCDEEGVLVWEEGTAWGNRKEHMADPEFIRLQVEQTKLMIRNSFNHPSVVIFSYLNEFRSDLPEGKHISELLVDTIKAEDSGRLVAFACCFIWNDISNDKTDLIAFNIYPGWGKDGTGSAEKMTSVISNAMYSTARGYRKKFPNKPIIISEMGTCGIFGFRERGAAQWTEDFQAEYNGNILNLAFANPDICGLLYWQFCDSRSFHRDGANIRTKPFAMNLGGLYDGYRREKLVVPVIREGFARKAAGENPVE